MKNVPYVFVDIGIDGKNAVTHNWHSKLGKRKTRLGGNFC